MRNIVTMSFYKEKTTMVKTPAYEFRPGGRFAFLQRWLWKTLWKFGALKTYWDAQVSVKRVNIDTVDFSRRLYESYHKCFPDYRPKRVYMGPNEFDELMYLQTKDVYPPFQFDIKIGYGGKLFDLPVEVIPHMNGVLII